jgi:hypothetical protein
MAIENVSCLSSLFRAHPAVEALYRSMDGEANPAGWAPAFRSPVACCGIGVRLFWCERSAGTGIVYLRADLPQLSAGA